MRHLFLEINKKSRKWSSLAGSWFRKKMSEHSSLHFHPSKHLYDNSTSEPLFLLSDNIEHTNEYLKSQTDDKIFPRGLLALSLGVPMASGYHPSECVEREPHTHTPLAAWRTCITPQTAADGGTHAAPCARDARCIVGAPTHPPTHPPPFVLGGVAVRRVVGPC